MGWVYEFKLHLALNEQEALRGMNIMYFSNAMRQMKGIMMVTAIFQSIILRHRSRIHQLQTIAMGLQAIDQPVPVEG